MEESDYEKSENRRIQNVLKYFMLCIIVLGVSFITGGKTVYAKLQISGDKSLIQVSKCSQTFDGTKDFVIWLNPAKIKKRGSNAGLLCRCQRNRNL